MCLLLFHQENELTCQAQLNQFPLVVQTPLLQRRVDDLNNKLKEIDAAKAIFGRSRVSKTWSEIETQQRCDNLNSGARHAALSMGVSSVAIDCTLW